MPFVFCKRGPDFVGGACLSWLLLVRLQDGQYRFHARAAGSGTTPGTEAVSGFTIDSVAPTVTITGACLRAGCRAGHPSVEGISLPQLQWEDHESQPPC